MIVSIAQLPDKTRLKSPSADVYRFTATGAKWPLKPPFIAALRIADADIIFSSCGFLFLFFPRLISAAVDWMSTILRYFHTWCGLSANLECRSEMCCTWLAEIQDAKKWPKIRHLGTIRQLCRAVSLQLRHVSTIGKKLLNSNTFSTCPHNMANLADQRLRSVREFGALQQISAAFASWLRYCSNVADRRPTKLCTMFGRPLGCYTIYTFSGLLPPDGIFAKSCVRLHWQRYCTALQQRASVKLCGVVQGMELRNFRRGRYLYSAGRPSRWATNVKHVSWQCCCAKPHRPSGSLSLFFVVSERTSERTACFRLCDVHVSDYKM